MKRSLKPVISGMVVLLVIVFAMNGANASIIQFQGGDAGANSTDPRPVSNATAASFDAAAGALGAINLINFESAPVGTFTSLVIAPGVTLSGTDFTNNSSGQSIRNAPFSNPDSLFGYNTTAGGSHFAFFNGGFLTFTFTTPLQAFGGYLSGLQLANETINFNDGSSQTISILNLGSGVQFAGFTDAGKLISSIMIDTRTVSNPLGDFVGIDDVRYVASSTIIAPEPTSLVLLGIGLVGMVLFHRRRKMY